MLCDFMHFQAMLNITNLGHLYRTYTVGNSGSIAANTI